MLTLRESSNSNGPYRKRGTMEIVRNSTQRVVAWIRGGYKTSKEDGEYLVAALRLLKILFLNIKSLVLC